MVKSAQKDVDGSEGGKACQQKKTSKCFMTSQQTFTMLQLKLLTAGLYCWLVEFLYDKTVTNKEIYLQKI